MFSLQMAGVFEKKMIRLLFLAEFNLKQKEILLVQTIQ